MRIILWKQVVEKNKIMWEQFLWEQIPREQIPWKQIPWEEIYGSLLPTFKENTNNQMLKPKFPLTNHVNKLTNKPTHCHNSIFHVKEEEEKRV